MKIIITEDQLNNIKDISKKKKFFFKYWEKYPKFDNDFIDFFGLDRFRRPLYEKDLLKIFREFLGGDDVVFDEANKILQQKPLHIDCGAYDFNISVPTVSKMDNETIKVEIIVDDESGYVMLAAGDIKQLSDAMNNDDYGWEVEQEINDCIFEFLQNIITEKTGLDIVIEDVSHLSRKPLYPS